MLVNLHVSISELISWEQNIAIKHITLFFKAKNLS